MAKAKKRSGKKAAAADAAAGGAAAAPKREEASKTAEQAPAPKLSNAPGGEKRKKAKAKDKTTTVSNKRPLEAEQLSNAGSPAAKTPDEDVAMMETSQSQVDTPSSSSSSSLDLKPSPLGGQGLFVGKQHSQGSRVYQDLAVLAVQDASSRSPAPFLCSSCLRATAGPAKQLRALLAAFTAAADGDHESDEEIDLLPLPPPDTKLLREYETRKGISSAVVPCNCEQFYCSEACRAASVAFHRRLCPAEEEDGERANDALQQFCEVALKRELPHYSFVALIFSRMVTALVEENRPVGWSNLPKPLSDLPLASWVQSATDVESRKARTKAIQGCLPLLSEIFVTPEVLMKMPAGNSDVLFNFELLDGIVGMLDRCVVDVECDNHFDKDLQSLTEEHDGSHAGPEPGERLPAAKRRKKTALSPGIVKLARVAANQDAVEKSSSNEAAPSLTRMLPRIRGVALVRGVALCNHSCEPNVSMEWHDRAELVVRASRTLQAGEEVLISYLGEDVSSIQFEERQARLADGWAFRCRCSRCLREAPKDWNWDMPVGSPAAPTSSGVQMDLDSAGRGPANDDDDQESEDKASDDDEDDADSDDQEQRAAAAKPPALRSWARRRAPR